MSKRISVDRLRRLVVWVVGARSSAAAVVHTLTANFGVLAINLITGMIIARVLEPRGRGEQAAMTLWPGVICGLLTFGLPTALRYYSAKDRELSEPLLSVGLIYGALFGLAGIGVGVVFIPHWLSHYSPGVIRFAQWLMLFAPSATLAWTLQGFLEGRGDFRQSNAIVYIPPVSTLIALLALLAVHRLNPFSSSLAYAIPPVLLMVWRLIALRRFISVPSAAEFRSSTRRLFSYGIAAYGLDVLNTLGSQINQALVIKFLSPAELGIYTVGLTVARLPGLLATALIVVLLPRASALERDAALALVARGARLTLAATAAFTLVFALIVPKAMPFVYGHSFAVSVRITQILFVQVTLGSTTGVFGQAFLATGRPGYLTVIQAIGLATTVPFTIILIPHFGIDGAALAMLCASFVRMALMLGSYPVFLKRPPPNLILTPNDIRFVLSTLSTKREHQRHVSPA